MPILQLFLARNCFLRRGEGFDVNEQVHAMFLDESTASAAAMLLKPGSKITGDADVERPVRRAGEDIDPIRVCAHCSASIREISNAASMGPGFRRDDHYFRGNELRTL